MNMCNVIPVFISIFLCSKWISVVVADNEGKTWFICVAGYDYYKYTYGFEGGIYRTCSTWAGQNNENLIIISPDTAAYHQKNPFPGMIGHGQDDIYQPPNFYKTVNVTYNSKDIDTTLFYQILNGNENAVKGIGNGKVLKSGPLDTVVLMFINIGDFGVMTLTNNAYLYAESFIPFLEELYQGKKFRKMLVIVDGVNAGSMFDNYLDSDKGILVMTNTARHDELDLCHYNDDVSAYTSTCYTFLMMEHFAKVIKEGKYDALTFHQFYQEVRTKSSFLSGVSNVYGQLDLGNIKLNEFFGPSSELKKNIDLFYGIHEGDTEMMMQSQR